MISTQDIIRDDPQPTFVPVKVRRVVIVKTKAILVRLNNGEEHWIPLSQVKPPETPFKQNQRNLTIEIADWVVENKRMGMSQRMPDDILAMIQHISENWDRFALGSLADRIRDSDGSWLEDCLRVLVGLSPVHQEIKTLGDFLNHIKNEEGTASYKRIFRACRFATKLFTKTAEMLALPIDQLVSHKKEDFLACPDFGQRSLVKMRLHLHQHGFLLEGDTTSAVEEMEESLWGVEDDDY